MAIRKKNTVESGGVAREMTLDEWCEQLHETHGARKELAALRERVGVLEEALREINNRPVSPNAQYGSIKIAKDALEAGKDGP